MDRRAKAGVRFTNGYIVGGDSAAVRLPIRTMLMTGRTLCHLPKDGGYGSDKPNAFIRPEPAPAKAARPLVPCMPTVFRPAGSRCFYSGKTGNTCVPGNRLFNEHDFADIKMEHTTPWSRKWTDAEAKA